MRQEYRFNRKTKGALLFMAIVMMLPIVTFPVAIYLLIRRSVAKLVFDAEGFTVGGLGLRQRWRYAEIVRIGILSVDLPDGGPAVAINGGQTAQNLLARTNRKRNLKFMLSRFEDAKQIRDRILQDTALPLETVTVGSFGVKWPDAEGPGDA